MGVIAPLSWGPPCSVWLELFRANKDLFTELLPRLGAHAATLGLLGHVKQRKNANWVGKI